MIRPELKYGLLAGAGMSLWFFAEYLLGLHTTHLALGETTGKLASLILIVALWLMLLRQQVALGPAFTVSRGLLTGLAASLVAATVIYIYQSLYNRYINPGWIDLDLKWLTEQMRAAGQPEELIRKKIQFFREANQPLGLLQYTLLMWTILGGMMSFFLSLWLKWQGRKAR